MKRKIFSYIVMLILILGAGCSSRGRNRIDIPGEMPQNFNIEYSFGVNEKNVLITQSNYYQKDMICDEPKQYNMEFTRDDLSAIYDAIVENNLFNVKDDFTENCNLLNCMGVSPESGATLVINIDGLTKTIKYRNNYINENDPELKRLMNVVAVIEGIVTQKETEQNIPQPKCAYI